MTLIGKRGDYYFYKCDGRLKFFDALPEVLPDYIIAGGAALAVLMGYGKVKDIDVWLSGDIPAYAMRESEFAFNYQTGNYPPVQYMKVKAITPSKLLESFDIDACKCALYNITDSSYNMCLHKYLKPLVYQRIPDGDCKVNPKAYNKFSTYRLHKYATKFKKSPLDMYSREDYAKALKFSEFSDRSIEEITEAIESFTGEDQYELIEHLAKLFTEELPQTQPLNGGINLDELFNASITVNMDRVIINGMRATAPQEIVTTTSRFANWPNVSNNRI